MTTTIVGSLSSGSGASGVSENGLWMTSSRFYASATLAL